MTAVFGENRGESAIDAKYAKYSTEQLEVILTHLSDPDEKELVKQELSRRYYNHYLGLINTPEGEPQVGSAPGSEAASPGPGAAGEDMPATGAPAGAYPALEEELAGIAAVAPPQLTLPPPEAAADLAEKTGEPAPRKKFCFIATAAYGTPLAPEVMVLQRFRDDYLAPHALGEKCIRVYYRLSPGIARQINRHPAWRQLTRFFLTPLILGIKKTFGSSSSQK
jgi:hypothetical protein